MSAFIVRNFKVFGVDCCLYGMDNEPDNIARG